MVFVDFFLIDYFDCRLYHQHLKLSIYAKTERNKSLIEDEKQKKHQKNILMKCLPHISMYLYKIKIDHQKCQQ